MKNNSNILNKIENNTDQKMKFISKELNPKITYRVSFLKNGKRKLMGIYDDNKLIINGDYHFYGIYQPYTKLWIWATSIPGVEKKEIKNIKKIRDMAHLFENDDNPKINFYYQLLTQDVLLVNNEVALDWINELLIFLSEDLFYFNPKNNEGNLQFLTLVDVVEKHS